MDSDQDSSIAERYVERRVAEKGLRPRIAASLIAVVWLAAIVVFGIVEHLIDSDTFGSVWYGMWWATQTVTTVGYGDVVPHNGIGQLVATILMVGGLSFFAVLTGWITTAFVTRAQALQERGPERAVEDKLDRLSTEIAALREQIAQLGPPRAGGA